MMIKFDLPDPGITNLVLGIGVFDGVHTGHQRIISELTAMGKRLNALPAAVTFLPHPREVLFPETPPMLLMPPNERIKKLCHAGARGIGIINFNKEVAKKNPDEFLKELLSTEYNICGICVGSCWRFGCKGDGDTVFLAEKLKNAGVEFMPVAELKCSGEIVSSTSIRSAIMSGNLKNATMMLGAYPALYGSVEHGFKDAGNVLSTPSANLCHKFGVLPPDGVYATYTIVDGNRLPSITNIGYSPTFKRGDLHRVESHILEFSGNIYGREIAIELVEKIRNEKMFSSPEMLRKQICLDCESALHILDHRGVL